VGDEHPGAARRGGWGRSGGEMIYLILRTYYMDSTEVESAWSTRELAIAELARIADVEGPSAGWLREDVDVLVDNHGNQYVIEDVAVDRAKK
jgi:hypothetical protein